MFSLFLSPLCNKTFFVSFQNQNDKLHPRRKQPLNNVQPVQDQKIFYFSSCLNVTASPVEFPDICVALVRFLFNNTVNREEQSSSVCCVLVFLIYVGSDSVCIRHVAAGEVSALHSPQVHCDRSWPLQWNSEVLFLWRNVCTSSSATVKKKKHSPCVGRTLLTQRDFRSWRLVCKYWQLVCFIRISLCSVFTIDCNAASQFYERCHGLKCELFGRF